MAKLAREIPPPSFGNTMQCQSVSVVQEMPGRCIHHPAVIRAAHFMLVLDALWSVKAKIEMIYNTLVALFSKPLTKFMILWPYK